MSHTRVLSLALVALSTLALAACPAKKSPSGPVGNTGDPKEPVDAAPGVADGALWTCQIGDYDPQPCKLSKDGAGWRLAKLLGSQRFKGTVAWPDASTIDFSGNFHCPWGDCGAEMNVTFRRSDAAFVTDFGGDAISLRYDDALATEWGGAGYGGLTGDEQ